MTCPTCGEHVAEGARFCSSCGHHLQARGDERRVATVLFADLVGFTSLSEQRDPEQVKNLVDSCFERLVQDINDFGGKVDKIIGDAILALFGAPTAHEDDAERAVRAALRMQETVAAYRDAGGAAVQLRIGVNTGEVLVGSLRAGAEYTAMGDAVNIAQRLQVSATPGAVVVGPATHAATRQVIGYRPLGPVAAKGRDEPVESWEAVSPLLPPGYRPRRVQTPFVGRQAELGMLDHAVAAAADRRRAHLVVLIGEAGLGKTRLAEETASRARRTRGALVYEGRCVPYGEANVWWPVAEALRQACGVQADDPLSRATERCAEAVAVALDRPADAPECTRVVNGVLYLMGYEGALREIDPQRAREEAVWAVLAFIEGSARRRPLVIVLSDLHWADDVVLDLLGVLVDRLSRCPVVLVATARHELHDRWAVPNGRHNNVVMNLDPLDHEAAAVLLDSLAESELDDELRAALLDRSGGNPFYLEELVALVASSEGDVSAALPAGGTGLDLPDTLRGLVSARIDGLSPSARATLEDAAVWGRSGPVEALQRMGKEMRGERLGEHLDVLVDAEILVVEGMRWSFRSDLIREVAYSTLTKADRARRHHGIASYLEHTGPPRREANERMVDVIAHHYAAAAELVAELGSIDDIPASVTACALDWLEEAARRAQVAQVLRVARRLVDQALALLGESPSTDADRARRGRLLLARARADSGLRNLDDAREAVAEARALGETIGDGRAVAEALLVLGDVEQKANQFDQAVRTLADAEARFRHLGDDAGVAEALRFRGMTHLFLGANQEAEACISAALDVFRALGDRRGEAWALQNLAWISFVEGRPVEAETRLTESAARFTELGDGGGLGWALGLLAFVRFHQGHLAEAEELGEKVLAETADRGDRWGEGMMLLLMASVRLWSGRAAAAVPLAERAVTTMRGLDDRVGETQAAIGYGRCLVHAGRVADGLAVLEGGVIDGEPALRDSLHDARVAGLSAAAVQIGDPGRALDALGHVGRPTAALEHSIGAVEAEVAHGLALLQSGDAVAAEALLRPATAEHEGGISSYAQGALALVVAARGGLDEVRALDAAVQAGPRATYLDRASARLALALATAARGDSSAVGLVAAVIAELDATEDVLAQGVARLVEAEVLDALDETGAAQARRVAERRLDELGITAEGWRTICRQVLSGDQLTTEHPVG